MFGYQKKVLDGKSHLYYLDASNTEVFKETPKSEEELKGIFWKLFFYRLARTLIPLSICAYLLSSYLWESQTVVIGLTVFWILLVACFLSPSVYLFLYPFHRYSMTKLPGSLTEVGFVHSTDTDIDYSFRNAKESQDYFLKLVSELKDEDNRNMMIEYINHPNFNDPNRFTRLYERSILRRLVKSEESQVESDKVRASLIR